VIVEVIDDRPDGRDGKNGDYSHGNDAHGRLSCKWLEFDCLKTERIGS